MFRRNARAAYAAAFLLAMTAGRTDAATFATFDANQYDTNGFRFGDLNDDFFGTFDTSGGVISLDVNNDFDLANGFFGGAGSDVAATFESATTQLEVTFAVGADNVASGFNVVLIDDDGLNGDELPSGEEYQYNVNFAGVTPGDGFVTQIISLDSFGFRQAAFGVADGDMELNYGLTQIQIQSQFGVADRLQVDIESVKLVDPDAPEDPLVVELTPATFAAQPQSFDFGIFQDAGVVDQTSGNFVIDANQSANPGDSGGLGFNGLNFDFDAATHEIQIEAKLLAGNTAESFNLLMGDNDGDDSGPELGNEDFVFTVPTDEFNETDFTTFTIPLGSGSESAIVTTFGSANGGDGLQNFDLTQLQIQVDSNAEGGIGSGLAIEIVGFRVVKSDENALPGDFDGDGDVDIIDFGVFADNFGMTGLPTDPATDGDFEPDGDVDIIDFGVFADNFGTGVPAAAVPEPATWTILTAVFVGAAARRRRR